MIENYNESQEKWKKLEETPVEDVNWNLDVWQRCGFCKEFGCIICPLKKKHCISNKLWLQNYHTMKSLMRAWKLKDQVDWVRLIKYFRRCMARYKKMF